MAINFIKDDNFEQVFKLGSKNAFGAMIKNIEEKKEAGDRFPKLGVNQRQIKDVAIFINEFFKVWKGVGEDIISKTNVFLSGEKYEIFSSDIIKFLSPTETQFIAIDSIIQFFIDNFFGGNLEKFNNWNIYASQNFYRGQHQIDFSGNFKSHTQLLNELGSKISKKEILQKKFFINGQEIILQTNSFFEKDLLDDLEEISGCITKILSQETFKKILQDDNLVVSYPVLNKKEDGKTILDIGLVLNILSQGRGLLFEALGFTQYAYGHSYSHNKEIQLLVNLVQGLAPIYIPYDNSYSRRYYLNAESQNVYYIGKMAPLITRTQFQSLLKALSLSGKSFSETLLLLSHDDYIHDFGFKYAADAIAIQKAFGLLFSEDNVVVDQNNNFVMELIDTNGNVNFIAFEVNMQLWWKNYANSNLEFVDSALNKMYAQLHFSV